MRPAWFDVVFMMWSAAAMGFSNHAPNATPMHPIGLSSGV